MWRAGADGTRQHESSYLCDEMVSAKLPGIESSSFDASERPATSCMVVNNLRPLSPLSDSFWCRDAATRTIHTLTVGRSPIARAVPDSISLSVSLTGSLPCFIDRALRELTRGPSTTWGCLHRVKNYSFLDLNERSGEQRLSTRKVYDQWRHQANPANCRLTPTVKQTSQDLERELCGNFRILIVSAVKIC